jgi:hypothetical protein
MIVQYLVHNWLTFFAFSKKTGLVNSGHVSADGIKLLGNIAGPDSKLMFPEKSQ